jgi:DNA-binding MarR family transcriptional regulator
MIQAVERARLSEKTKDPKDVLTEADYVALAQFRYALRRFSAFSATAAHKAGLPAQQHQALLAIKGTPPGEAMTVGTLADRLLVAPHSATELVDRLARAGLVERVTDPDDHRRQVLCLTQRANRLLARLGAVHLREIRDMAPRLIATLRELSEGPGD